MMFGLAAAASCMPCQADWLNDLSLMPPVSVTMQPRNLPVVDAPVVVDALAGLDAAADADVLALAPALAELLALLELLPHAAISRVAALAATAVINAVGFTVSSTGLIAGIRA